jgi:nucleoside diphosphate kinase
MSKLFVIIKPWSIQHVGTILSELDHQGQRLQTATIEHVKLEDMAKHYEVYKERSNYQDMIHDFENLSVILAVYEGDIVKFNELKNKIRKRFASDIPLHKTHLRNALHMSGDDEEFKREYAIWKEYLK